ncbi:unnamed protein product [Hydatigera taeniaeformis]|uniref:rRNA N-glycosidase n=1 Tax=Hydatigena taeniaeformis TaxID=6205 RepID=A0A0R3WXN9_HYDTA|nr:unnamed protein product [Hydatigera taeniaeformis]
MPKRRAVKGDDVPPKRTKCYSMNNERHKEVSALIDSTFLLKCPPEFYEFYAFCCSIFPDSPLDALYRDIGIRLVGPFEVLHEPMKFKLDDDFTDCYRYFHDPPEMVTILAQDGENPFHVGYFRGDYADQPSFLVSSNPSETGKLTISGRNIFATVLKLLVESKTRSGSTLPSLSKLREFAKGRQICVDSRASVDWKPTCETLNGVGFKIDLQNGVGYRPVPTTHSKFSTIVARTLSLFGMIVIAFGGYGCTLP